MQLIRGSRIDRIEITGDGLQLVLQNGLRIYWEPSDIRTAPNMLVNNGDYEPDELALLEFLAQDCRVILDIGANVGWYTLHFARLVSAKGGQIYAIEPVPQTFAELIRNVALNEFDGTVHVSKLALSDAEQTVQLYVPHLTGSAAASQQQLFPSEKNQTVECLAITLNAFVTQQHLNCLDLIKCDVEGAELFVMLGGINAIETHQPIIMLEMLRKWAHLFKYHPNDLIALLSRCGYACWSFENRRLIPVFQVDDASVQTNFFFFHRIKHMDFPMLINRNFGKAL